MLISKNTKDTLKNLIIFTIIGLLGGIIVMYFVENLPRSGKNVVEISEISAESAQQLADAARQQNQTSVASYANAVEAAASAVVNIFTSKTIPSRESNFFNHPGFDRFFGDRIPKQRQRQENSLGSGVIISSQGYLLTNHHVIKEAEEIQVALRDGRSANATIVGVDAESDIALLKIELDELPAITLGASDNLKIGDVVLAIGNPFGVGQTVTMGIVSATGRDRLGLNTFENFIQTDAAINPGNSGGALINTFGHLVGVNTAIFSRSGGSQGIGFAIPVNLVKNVTQQIIENGHVVRGWLGIEVQDISPALAVSFNLPDTSGVIVAGVLRSGPADVAGLKPGDAILQIGNEKVADSRHAVKLISNSPPGTPILMTVIRNSESIELTAQTSERPAPTEQ